MSPTIRILLYFRKISARNSEKSLESPYCTSLGGRAPHTVQLESGPLKINVV